MKILHLIPRFIGGGPERGLLAAVREMEKLGVQHRHTVAVLDPPVAPAMLLSARRLNVELVSRPEAKSFQDLARAADVIVIHFWNHPHLNRLLRTVPFPAARIIVWSHVLGTHAPQVLTGDVGRFADRLILTSGRSRRSEGAYAAGADGTPVHIVPGVGDKSRLDGFSARPHEACNVGYIGTVAPTKMHPRFAEMCAEVRDPSVRFIVCGSGGEEELRHKIDTLGIADRMDVCGPVQDIRSVLEIVDIFGYPLASDTYATSEAALQEAMWVGIPPVVFPHGGVVDIVQHECTGLVVEDEAEYARAIDRLAGDPHLRRTLGDAAKHHARKAFDPDYWTRRLIEVIDDLYTQSRRERPLLHEATGRPAQAFVRSLGPEAGPFSESLRADDTSPNGATLKTDRAIAASATLLAKGEGGVIHHRNTYSDDPWLRLWSGLTADGNGNRDLAIAEYRAAKALGLSDGRPDRYERDPCLVTSNDDQGS